jgi:hypothetical protein
VSNDKIIKEKCVRRGMEGSGNGLYSRYYPGIS